MTDTSVFDNHADDQSFSDAELLDCSGTTCDAYRVRRYGKWHFLKRLKPEYAHDPRYVAAMEKEFETAYRLDHPALPRYIERGSDYILMEFIDGQTLTEYLNEHPKAFADKKHLQAFCQQLLHALQYLHAHQILHLDLKPDNILITRIGHEVRLVDFGFCYTDSSPFTTGHTDHYAAPEQTADEGPKTFTPATDLYAFGRILMFISSSVPLPSIFHKVILRCQKEHPEDRYQSAQEVMEALAHKTSRTKTIVVATLLALLIALGLWWLFSGSRQSDTSSQPAQPVSADSLASSIDSAKQDTASSSAPLNVHENHTTPIPQSAKQPEETSLQPKETSHPSPLEQPIVGNISYLEKGIKEPIPTPSKGKYPDFDAAVIAACEPVFRSTVNTFQDSVYSESSSVMRNWTMAMKQCRAQLPPIEQALQLQFNGQVPSREVTYYLNDYVSAKFNRIVHHMLLNAYRQGYRP